MDTNGVLKKAADKCGLTRIKFRERNMPTSPEGITILPFFGDNRSTFILSSLLLRRIKEEAKGSRYLVLASWPGNEGLFPYVDEYWQVEDDNILEKLRSGTNGFNNKSIIMSIMIKNLNHYFHEVMTHDDISPFYENGITKEFFDRFKHVKVFLPHVPSLASMGAEFARSLGQKENKVFVYPSKDLYCWRNGRTEKIRSPVEFWISLADFISSAGFFPVICSDGCAYDFSSEFNKNCLHMKNLNALEVLSVMRTCGCTLDVFNGISRYSIAARSPFVCLEERQKFNYSKDYEINDLCGRDVPREYIFSFCALIKGDKSVWRSNIFDHLVVKLSKLHEHADRESWPPTAETNEIVPYDSVRKKKNKRLGTRFLRIQRD